MSNSPHLLTLGLLQTITFIIGESAHHLVYKMLCRKVPLNCFFCQINSPNHKESSFTVLSQMAKKSNEASHLRAGTRKCFSSIWL